MRTPAGCCRLSDAAATWHLFAEVADADRFTYAIFAAINLSSSRLSKFDATQAECFLAHTLLQIRLNSKARDQRASDDPAYAYYRCLWLRYVDATRGGGLTVKVLRRPATKRRRKMRAFCRA